MANTDPQGQLQAAAKAWGDLLHAETQMSRLRAYSSMTRGMKDDFAKASQLSSESRRTLHDVLKVPA